MELRRAILLTPLPAMMLVAACSSQGGPDYTKETPGYQWEQAHKQFSAGNPRKAYEHLQWLVRTENPHLAHARVQLLILQSGLIHGYLEVADRYRRGSAGNVQMQSRLEEINRTASDLAFQFGQTYLEFQKAQPFGEVGLAFGLPPGNAEPPEELSKLDSAARLPEAERDTAIGKALEWGVLLAVCDSVGSRGNPAEAGKILRKLPVMIPRAVFELGMAKGLYRASEMFGPARLADRIRQDTLLYQARSAAANAPEGAETTQLQGLIEAALKANSTR
jgi:hypothetical protein